MRAGDAVCCPRCEGEQVNKKISAFAFKSSGGFVSSSSRSSCSGCKPGPGGCGGCCH
ncbi:MAG: transcriptional regulator [Vicinamibacteria bacterium]|nr:transcriptional regulator [Vicinamibacteria bacterium]